jgi:hypothetical protein
MKRQQLVSDGHHLYQHGPDCINNNQTCDLETPETDPATESVNTYDSSSHTPVRRPGLEAAKNHLQSPIADIESNVRGVEYRNHELASESAAEYFHTRDDWEKEGTNCLNSVTYSTRLEENLAEFFKEAKTLHRGTETPRTQTRSEPPPRGPRQFQH